MAKELLGIPEENLEEFIEILELGLKAHKNTSKDVEEGLRGWIKEQNDYIK